MHQGRGGNDAAGATDRNPLQNHPRKTDDDMQFYGLPCCDSNHFIERASPWPLPVRGLRHT